MTDIDETIRVVDSGVTCLHPGGSNPKADLVFVHGLGGHPQKTWSAKPHQPTASAERRAPIRERIAKKLPGFLRSKRGKVHDESANKPANEIFWPRDLLPVDVIDVRVLTFGYYSSPVHSSQDNLYTLSKNLLIRVAHERRNAPYRPIIFIAHSLGGILTKFALKLSQDSSGTDAWLKTVRDSTAGVIFFGTPHSGSSMANWGELIRRIFGVFTVTHPSLLAALNSADDNGQLEELRMNFIRMLGPGEQGKFPVFSFRETKPLANGPTGPLANLVVPFASSQIDSEWASDLTVPENHRDICRFGGAEDSKYSEFLKVLRRILDNISTDAASVIPPALPRGKGPGVIRTLPGIDIGGFVRSQERPQAESCDWIPKHENFQKWIRSPDTHVLHVVGEPGSGKSTAATWLFDNALTWWPERKCAIFSFQSERKNGNASAAWGSLLQQLVDGEVVSVPSPKTMMDLPGAWSEHILRDTFVSSLTNMAAVYLIDAVDECESTSASEFLQSLSQLLVGSGNSAPKLLLFSRHSLATKSGIDAYFRSSGGTERIDMNAEGQHIRNVERYIRTKVDDLCVLRPGLAEFRDEIVGELDRRSTGIYLLPSLTLQSLAKSKASPAEIRKILGRLPQDLRSIYSDALQKVSPADQKRVSVMLLWLVFAVRPLRDTELSAAIEFCCADFRFSSLTRLDYEVSRDILGTSGISELVGPLIKATADGCVSMVHSSAREYIIDLAINTEPHDDLSWVWCNIHAVGNQDFGDGAPSQVASHALSIYCQDLALFADELGLLKSLYQENEGQKHVAGVLALLRYSVENLPDHIRQCSQNLPSPARGYAAFNRVFDTNSEGSTSYQHGPYPDDDDGTDLEGRPWFQHDPYPADDDHSDCEWHRRRPVWLAKTPKHRSLSPGGPAFRLARFLEQVPAGTAFMRQFWKLRDPTQQYRDFSSLHFCCALGLTECVKALLPPKHYPRRKLQDLEAVFASSALATSYLTAVDIAAMFGNTEIIRILCKRRGTPVNSDHLIPLTTWKEGGPGHSLIHMGARDIPDPAPGTVGEEVVKERENAAAELIRYQPLHTATKYGQVEAMEYLIALGSDLACEDEDGKWPIEVALDHGIDKAVSCLINHHHLQDLKKPIVRLIQRKSHRHLALLSERTRAFWEPTIQLDNFSGECTASVIHIAAAVGEVDTLTFLAALPGQSGRLIQVDSEGRAALHYAAGAGQVALVEHIMNNEPGAWRAEDNKGRNPLYYAISGLNLIEKSWLPSAKQKASITGIIEHLPAKFSSTLVQSTLMSLAGEPSFNPDQFSGGISVLEQGILAGRAAAPAGVRMGGDFLRRAFMSSVFPLDIALDMSLRSDRDSADGRGWTALHVAAAAPRAWKQPQAQLAKSASDINRRDKQGKTPLQVALEASLTCKDEPPLHRLATLVSLGATVDGPEDESGDAPITTAAKLLLANSSSSRYSQVRPVQLTGLFHLLLSGKWKKAANMIPTDLLAQLLVSLRRGTSWRDDVVAVKSSLSALQIRGLLDHVLAGASSAPAELVILFRRDWPTGELAKIIEKLDSAHLDSLFILACDTEDTKEIETLCRARL